MDPAYLEEYMRIVRTYWWSRSRHAFTGRLVRRGTGRPLGAVLDVGCLNGPVLEQFPAASQRAGVDVSATSLSRVPPALRGAARLARATAEHLPHRDAAFDAVTSVDVLEHVPDDLGALREMFRVLAPGGVAVIVVPAHAWLRTSRDGYLGHLRRYSRRGLTERLANAGFEIEHATYLASSMLVPLLGLRLAERFGGRQIRAASHAGQRAAGLVNHLLFRAHALEAWLALRLGLPIGSAVAVLARKPSSSRAG